MLYATNRTSGIGVGSPALPRQVSARIFASNAFVSRACCSKIWRRQTKFYWRIECLENEAKRLDTNSGVLEQVQQTSIINKNSHLNLNCRCRVLRRWISARCFFHAAAKLFISVFVCATTEPLRAFLVDRGWPTQQFDQVTSNTMPGTFQSNKKTLSKHRA